MRKKGEEAERSLEGISSRVKLFQCITRRRVFVYDVQKRLLVSVYEMNARSRFVRRRRPTRSKVLMVEMNENVWYRTEEWFLSCSIHMHNIIIINASLSQGSTI